MMTTHGNFIINIRHIQLLAARKGHNINLNKSSKTDLELARIFIRKVE